MSSLKFKTLRENIVEALRTKILKQELVPGKRIIEQDLADEFGTSRGPIREALRQLEQEGLIEYTRNVGCSVKIITLQDIYEIYLLRSHLEIMAIRELEEGFSDEEKSVFMKTLEQMYYAKSEDRDLIVELDNQFHEVIVKKANLPRLYHGWKQLDYGNLMISMVQELHQFDPAKTIYNSHKLLLDVLFTGTMDEKCNAIYHHYIDPIKKYLQ